MVYQCTSLMHWIFMYEPQLLWHFVVDCCCLFVAVNQPKFEAIMSEVDIVINELHHAIANLRSWMQPQYVGTNLASITIYYDGSL